MPASRQATGVGLVAVVRVSAIRRTALIRNWITIQAIIVLTWLPGLIAMYLANQGDPLGGYRWVPPSTLHHVWSVISAVYLFRASDITTFELLPTRVPGFGAATVALALFGAWRLRADPKLLTVIGLAVMTMPIVILVISIFQAFWIPRYLLWSTGPFFAMVGIGAAALPRRLFPLAAVALVVGGIVNLAPYYRYETKPRWDLAAAYLAANARPGDSIVTNSTAAEYVLRVYGDRYYLNQPIYNASEIANVATRFQEARNVWVMYGRTGQGNMAPEAEYLKKWSALGAPISTIKFGRHIVAFRFEPSTTRSTMGRKSPPANN
jgi:mannosyltransferase